MGIDEGLVSGFILKDGGGKPINWEGVRKWTPSDGVLWLHLDYTSNKVRNWLHTESGIDPVLSEALLAEETRPRVVSTSDSLLLILRGVNCNPGSDPEDMVSIRMWFDNNRNISMRHRLVMAIDDIRQSIEARKGPASPHEFLVMVISKLTDRMGDVISEIDDRVDELEDMVLTAESRELRP